MDYLLARGDWHPIENRVGARARRRHAYKRLRNYRKEVEEGDFEED